MPSPEQFWKDQMAYQAMTQGPLVTPEPMYQTGSSMIPQIPLQAGPAQQVVVLPYDPSQAIQPSSVALPSSTPTMAVQNGVPPAMADAAAKATPSKTPLLLALAAIGAAVVMNK
jgi:hypothetical protein